MDRHSFKEFRRDALAFAWDIRWGIVVATCTLAFVLSVGLGAAKVTRLINQRIGDEKAEWVQFSEKHNCRLVKDSILFKEYECEGGTIYLKLPWES